MKIFDSQKDYLQHDEMTHDHISSDASLSRTNEWVSIRDVIAGDELGCVTYRFSKA